MIDLVRDIRADDHGNLHAAGYFQSIADFDPGPAIFNLTSAGNFDVFAAKLLSCVRSHTGPETYGALLFSGTCAYDAGVLAGGPGTPYVYSTLSIPFFRTAGDSFYLSSKSDALDPLVVDDAVAVNGVDTGLGPYNYEIGVPPFKIGHPMEENFVPEPAYNVTGYLPEGRSTVVFELYDTQREIYGNTAVYLVRDCGLRVQGSSGQTTLDWLSHVVEVDGAVSNLDLVGRLLSHLRADRGFARTCFEGSYTDTTEIVHLRPDPPSGDGFYFLVNGTCAEPVGYGYSSFGPRAGLPPAQVCPQ